jgi:translation initiation factor IF-2
MSKPNEQLIERPPIVAVLGHVDHGKSTLLDFIRKSNIVAGEAGGITQHVVAYEVEREKDGQTKRITFIDTPGHAAFAAIRARGANVADIAILVVAADDGVKAQTLEALKSIRDAKTPFIVAINKIDKPNANLDRTVSSLLEQNVFLEKYGGDVPWAAVSAKVGTGVDELLDLILIVAELQEQKADPSIPAEGYVIEAHRDQKRGLAATLIIKNGTLKSGMAVVAGTALAPVRIMENHAGKQIREATFSSPVQLIGFDELPEVGTEFKTFAKKRDAETAQKLARMAAAPTRKENAVAEEDAIFRMPVIIRADTTGSLEAIMLEVSKLGDEHSAVAIVQSGIGNISESDVKAAVSSHIPTAVIGFNVGVDGIAEALAQRDAITVETFDIIYKLTERLEELLTQTRPKREIERIVGRAKVLKQFSSRKDEHVVGGSVAEGYLERKAAVRVIRRGAAIGIGKIKNIQSNKQNVDRVETGSEFGAQIEAPFEVAQGDTLEGFVTTTE